MLKICVIGANGLLGSRLLASAKSKFDLTAVDLKENPVHFNQDITYIQADITIKDQINSVITSNDFEYIINTAALTDVDYCEDDPDLAYKINASGAGYVAQAAKETGAKLIHLSTDYVYDGENGPYTETDTVNPISVYGKSKYEGELIVRDISEETVIARTMILYGLVGSERSNFVTWLVNMLTNRKNVSIVNDQWGTPTFADDLAEALLTLLEKNASGLFHTSGFEVVNRYEFALKIAEIFNLDSTLITEVTSEQFPQKAKRPLRSGLVCDKLSSVTGFSFPEILLSLTNLRTQMEGAGE